MNAITIDKLSPQTWDRISERARAHHKSIEAEAAAILESAVSAEPKRSKRQGIVDRIASMTPKGVVQTDSTSFIRAERDRQK
jgi:plasmid stability protein